MLPPVTAARGDDEAILRKKISSPSKILSGSSSTLNVALVVLATKVTSYGPGS